FDTDDTAHRRRLQDGTAGVSAHRGHGRIRGNGGGRTSAGVTRFIIEIPWVAGSRHVLCKSVVCELRGDGLPEYDGAVLYEPGGHGRVVWGNVFPEHL